jgi:hypothetical protein
MADDTAKRDYRDRDRINVHEDYELRYWTKELGVTPDESIRIATICDSGCLGLTKSIR